jgi:hypothetical protein
MYNKILIAKHSPQNGCFVEEGKILTIYPKEKVPNKSHVTHYFVDSEDLKTKSRYGWVKEVPSFNIGDFINQNLRGIELSSNELEHIRIMLDSILKLEACTPVAATYSQRGVGNKQMKFTVHKVFFFES